MPQWINQPPKATDVSIFRIIRTPANKPLQAIITCTDLVGCNTHYASNRTVPCDGQGQCQWCANGYSHRWHGYVSAIMLPGLEHVLFECTATAADVFRNYYQLHDTLRACHFQATRPSKRPNGRVVIATRPGDPNKVRLPQPPDIRRILCHLWNVRYDTEQPTGMDKPPFKTIGLPDDNTDGRYQAQA